MNPENSGTAARQTLGRHARGLRSAMYGLYTLVVVVMMLVPEAQIPVLANAMGFFGLLALIFGVTSATRRTLPVTARRAWCLLSIGFLILNLVPIAVTLSVPPVDGRQTGISLDPSYADLLRLSAVLPMLAALISFPRSHTTRRDTHKLLLDIVTVIGGGFMLIWFLVLGPALTSHLPTLTMVVAALYPIGDLALLFGAAVVVLRGAHASVQRPMTILLTGMVMLIVSDTYLGYIKLHPDETFHPVPQMLALMTGLFLIAVAGLEQCLLANAKGAEEARRRPSSISGRLPYAALAAGSILLIVEAARDGFYPWGGLIVGAVVMTGSVAFRQFIAIRENHELITRDSLTGLSNRVRLHEALELAVDRSNRTGQQTAVMLIDMDGFKQINDTLGHNAGDQLLVGFANLLKASVLGSDTVARLGGDEFAIVLNNVGTVDNAGAVATRIIAGMQVPVAINGEPVCPIASIGIAVTVPGRPTVAADLLHQGDMAMYRAKDKPGSAYQFHTLGLSTTIL